MLSGEIIDVQMGVFAIPMTMTLSYERDEQQKRQHFRASYKPNQNE